MLENNYIDFKLKKIKNRGTIFRKLIFKYYNYECDDKAVF